MFLYIYQSLSMTTRTDTHKHTQGLLKCKIWISAEVHSSQLDFLPELGYVYICYSILKPSNDVLSCTPSQASTFIRVLWALQKNWYWHGRSNPDSICFWQPMLERCRQSCFPTANGMLTFVIGITEQLFISSSCKALFSPPSNEIFCIGVFWFTWLFCKLIWYTLSWLWGVVFCLFFSHTPPPVPLLYFFYKQVVWFSVWHWELVYFMDKLIISVAYWL